MAEADRIAAAAHLYVAIRRKLGRVTDAEWMVRNADYAREVIRLARSLPDTELGKAADRFEGLSVEAMRSGATAAGAQNEPPPRYIGTLR